MAAKSGKGVWGAGEETALMERESPHRPVKGPTEVLFCKDGPAFSLSPGERPLTGRGADESLTRMRTSLSGKEPHPEPHPMPVMFRRFTHGPLLLAGLSTQLHRDCLDRGSRGMFYQFGVEVNIKSWSQPGRALLQVDGDCLRRWTATGGAWQPPASMGRRRHCSNGRLGPRLPRDLDDPLLNRIHGRRFHPPSEVKTLKVTVVSSMLLITARSASPW